MPSLFYIPCHPTQTRPKHGGGMGAHATLDRKSGKDTAMSIFSITKCQSHGINKWLGLDPARAPGANFGGTRGPAKVPGPFQCGPWPSPWILAHWQGALLIKFRAGPGACPTSLAHLLFRIYVCLLFRPPFNLFYVYVVLFNLPYRYKIDMTL